VLGVLVMLNNFFHDLSVALFTCAVVGRVALWRSALSARAEAGPVVLALDRLARRLTAWSLAAIVGFGAVRLAAFERYEWLPALGRDQIPALAAKHVLLVSLLLWAVWAARRARALAAPRLASAPAGQKP